MTNMLKQVQQVLRTLIKNPREAALESFLTRYHPTSAAEVEILIRRYEQQGK